MRKLSQIRSAIGAWIARSPSTRDPRLFLFYLKRLRLLQMLGFCIYDSEFFADHLRLEKGYLRLAAVIHSVLRPATACDLGCGNGQLIDALKGCGVHVKGVEGSREALPHIPKAVRNDISFSDVRRPLSLGSFDLVICTEVAEHISPRYAHVLIDNIVRHATKNILFTAAQPGQWGDGHINCRPKEYWKERFRERGWDVKYDQQDRIDRGIQSNRDITTQLPWIEKNLLVLAPS